MDPSSSSSNHSKENQCCLSSQGNEPPVTPDLNKETRSDPEGEATELLQCKMVIDPSSSSSYQRKGNQCCLSSQGNEPPVTPDLNKETRSDPEGEATELPQCKMGTKKVDDMSFMISCTNWY